MTRLPLEIDRYMSCVVVLIDASQPLSEAIRLMRVHELRHLPVVAHGQVVGLLGEREVQQVLGPGPSVDSRRILVADAMSRFPYTVEPDEPIDRVAREMARRRIGAAVIAHCGKLRGLFTATDALLALAALAAAERDAADAVRAARAFASWAGPRAARPSAPRQRIVALLPATRLGSAREVGRRARVRKPRRR